MFPSKLSDLDHLRSEKMIKFKEEIVNGKSVTIVSYMVSSPELWQLPFALECRGITFDTESGDCISAPFHKFFNVGENESTRPETLPWDKIVNVLEKRDGSMLVPVLVNGEVAWKTKKSFYSDVAVAAAAATSPEITSFSKELLLAGFSPIFEFTAPQCEIVINYGKTPTLVLLAIRNMSTGEYVSYNEMWARADAAGVLVIRSYNFTYRNLVDQMKVIEDFEGYVIRFESNNSPTMVKMKCEWYLRMHRAKTELRERDVADMFLDETIDDIKTVITQAGLSLAPIEAIEHRVTEQLRSVMTAVDALLIEAKLLPTRKDVAITYNNHPLFGLLMTAYTGKDPDYKKYWTNNYREGYTLNTIYSNFKNDDA